MTYGLLFVIPVLLISVFFIVFLLIRKTDKTSMEIMLLGLVVMVLGGIFVIDPDSNLAGVEYFIVLLGFGISAAGFMKRSQ